MLRTTLVVQAQHLHGTEPKQLTPRQRRLQKQHKKYRQEQQQRPQPEHEQPPARQLPTGGERGSGGGQLRLECPHFALCSGCALDTGLDTPPVFQEAQRFFAEQQGLDALQLHAGRADGWRKRARLAVRPGADGRPVIGLFQEGSHTTVPIPSCVVHHPAINLAVRLLETAVATCGVQPYDEVSGSGDLRYVQLTVVEPELSSGGSIEPSDTAAAAAAQVQLVLVWNAPAGSSSAQLAALANTLWQAAGKQAGGNQQLHSIWANYQQARTNTILGPSWKLLHGEELAWAQLGGADICFGPGSFMQANFGAMDACLAAMQHHVPAGSTVTDLHAGVGTIGLSLAATQAPRWVRFVEINGHGLPPFRRSEARLLQQQQAAGTGGSSDGSSLPAPALEYHVGAAGSNPGRWCQGAEVVVCDPPRKGLEPQLLAWLCSRAAPAAGVQRLLYLSCGFPALQRDCNALVSSGRWRLRYAEAFLFFPGADHIETLAVFDAV